MREVDRRTIEMGIPGTVLMENAGTRVVEFLADGFAPLAQQRIVVFCGKGNNGGDGMVVARQLFTQYHPQSLTAVLVGDNFFVKALVEIMSRWNYRSMQHFSMTETLDEAREFLVEQSNDQIEAHTA